MSQKSEKRRQQRERKRLERFQKQVGSQVPQFFQEWITNLSTDDQIRELEIARVNLARIRRLRIVV